MYRHNVNHISEPNGRFCFLKGAHNSSKAKKLGFLPEMSEFVDLWVCKDWQGARGVMSRGKVLTAHTPQAALSCTGPCTRDMAVLSPLILLHLPRAGRVKPQQFPSPHTHRHTLYFLSLLELLGLCTSGSIHCQQFRFSFSPSLGDTFPEPCCGA